MSVNSENVFKIKSPKALKMINVIERKQRMI